ncbi:MAG: hypothetical protein IPK25_08300 [Saprospiraceae bacterium]|nr:hypothetical protein [Saprospiraceae bacterium]
MIATGVPVFSGDDVEVWVFNACSADIASGKIDLRINSEDGPFQVIYYDENLNELKNISVQEGNGGEEDLDNLMAGDYRVKVINRNCSVLEIEVNVGAISNIEIRADISPICQFGTGRIIPEITGVVEPVTYTWSNGDLTKDITNLDAGSYSLSITDSRGCFKEVDFTLHNSTSPFWFADNLEIIPPSTCSSTDGYIRAWRPSVVTGGVAPLTYLWSNGASTNSIGPVKQGIYTVTITGSDGCKGIKEQELLSDNAMEIIYDEITPVCPELNDGRIEVIANHPATYYCEQLNYISTDGLELNNLYAGTYCISVVSLNNELCKIDKCYIVGDKIKEGNLNITGTVKKSCPGENNGTINLVISGGYSDFGYEVQWTDNVGYWTYASNLSPGVYSVSVSDVCGETSFQSFTVEEWNYQPITHNYDIEKINGVDYVINYLAGGSGQFSYKWEYLNSYGQWKNYNIFTKDINASYLGFLGDRTRFMITDLVSGCTFIKIFECVEFTIKTVPTCPTFSAGSISLSPIYNNEGLNYLWSNNINTKDVTDLSKGDYYVTITKGGCKVVLGPIKIEDKTPIEWKSTFSVNEVTAGYQCGYDEVCNTKKRYVEYNENNPIHIARLEDKTKSKLTLTDEGCNKVNIYCPATNTTKEVTRQYIYNPDWINCQWQVLCPNTGAINGLISGKIEEVWEPENNKCIRTEICILVNPISLFREHTPPEGINKEEETNAYSGCCVHGFIASNVSTTQNYSVLKVDYPYTQEIYVDIQVMNAMNELVFERKSFPLEHGEYKLYTTGWASGTYTITIKHKGHELCGDKIAKFNVTKPNLPVNCPVIMLKNPGWVYDYDQITFQTSNGSPNPVNAKVIVKEGNVIKKEMSFDIPTGEKEIKTITIADLSPVCNQVYAVEVEIQNCPAYIFEGFFGCVFKDDDPVLKCKNTTIDITYDSLQNHFTYFLGKNSQDSVFGYNLLFDTLNGFYNEFTHHEIQWDWVKHVRYDSTKTVYYFGTDSIIRSFITSVDSNGQSYTHWYNDIVFVSCGPLNKQGIWTLIGYKVSEQRYYMYVFDKVNLTTLPLDIPNENRGQTYTTVWNFGPDEYATKLSADKMKLSDLLLLRIHRLR